MRSCWSAGARWRSGVLPFAFDDNGKPLSSGPGVPLRDGVRECDRDGVLECVLDAGDFRADDKPSLSCKTLPAWMSRIRRGLYSAGNCSRTACLSVAAVVPVVPTESMRSGSGVGAEINTFRSSCGFELSVCKSARGCLPSTDLDDDAIS